MTKKITQKQIIVDFKNIHGNTYDYSKVNYVNTRTEVEIICKNHGSFFQKPSSHKKRGCPKCGRLNKKPRITQESILKEFNKVHGDRYDYSLMDYISATDKVEIICKDHGTFLQTPTSHKNGANCPICVKENRYNDMDKILEQFKAVHGDKYDYSKVEYVNNKTKVEIICTIHGKFMQHPYEHKRGSGCPVCAKENQGYKKNIISVFKDIHGDKFDYSKVKFINVTSLVEIICKDHGSFFQSPFTHKQGGQCPECVLGKRRLTIDEVLSDFKKIHNDTYDYSRIKDYKNNKTKLEIICKDHGSFFQNADVHKRGSGCPTCAQEKNRYNTSQIYKNRKTTLYYVKVNDFFKIGVTLKSVKSRFYSDIKKGVSIEVIKTWEFDDGADAYNKEQSILFENRKCRYFGEKVLNGGDSELFTVDVLGLTD